MVDDDCGVVEGHAQVWQSRIGRRLARQPFDQRGQVVPKKANHPALKRASARLMGFFDRRRFGQAEPVRELGQPGQRITSVPSRTIRRRNEATSPLRWPRKPGGDTRPGCSIARPRPVPGPLTKSAGSGQPPITAASRSAGRSRTCCTTVRGAGVAMVLKRSVKIISRARLPSTLRSSPIPSISSTRSGADGRARTDAAQSDYRRFPLCPEESFAILISLRENLGIAYE